MKTILILSVAVTLCTLQPASAQKHPALSQPPAPDPIPIYLAPPVRPINPGTVLERQVYIYDQKPLPRLPLLISPEEAQGIIDRFRTNYVRSDNPRILIFVNRHLVEPRTVSSTNPPAPEPAPTLADRQTIRDVERLFGRPLRLANASLVDQAVADLVLSPQLPPEPGATNTIKPAGKEPESVARIADVVIEVLINSREVPVTEVSGVRVYNVPDIQATAIRVRDSKIIGQATAADLIGHGPAAGLSARSFSVQDITEATALALMADLLQASQPK